ncbi:Hypp4316 [Branchiostoma lanceolatum]|uniref:phosphoethanolamine N-methyltransferase n=1 Tax=Branchiostoma lanceolatum TaxID=7740 RepID=A0A8K0A777_BRALA|nr:Hypp4316 [Branchiostoma lanceolatum]
MSSDCGESVKYEAARNKMAQFWREHSAKASLEEMMLDDNAKELSKDELPEILSLLPGIEGKAILELGAGIGRYTAPLAQKAKHVTAVDFMESFIRKNEEVNGHHGNVRFMQADVTKLEMPPKSFDIVFSNWLMMYLSDAEVQALVEKVLTWLKDDGIFFFRESCFHPCGDHVVMNSSNPTKYRKPSDYDSFIQAAGIPIPGENGGVMHFGFEIQLAKSLETYLKARNNANQVCWVTKKRRLQDGAQQ